MGADGTTSYAKDTKAAVEVSVLQHPKKLETAAVLAHELIHTALGYGEDHGERFDTVAKTIGLAGPPEATVAGPKFREFYNRHLAGIADA